jgi:hypothetical protein
MDADQTIPPVWRFDALLIEYAQALVAAYTCLNIDQRSQVPVGPVYR